MALVMVMVVLAALLVIATPFAISMMFHEKTTRTVVDQEHAAYGAEAARNHAVATLAWGHPSAEADKNADPPFNTPEFDSLAETTVVLDDPVLAKSLEIASPRGRLLGLAVQDEQGKLNLRSASSTFVTRVRRHLGGRFANLRDVFTTHSHGAAEWIPPARVRSAAPGADGITTQLFLDDATWFGVGTRVRITAGSQVVYAPVIGNDGTTFEIGILLEDPFDTKNAVVEALARHPININTASREVLLSLFEDVSWSDNNPEVEPEAVSQKASEYLVDRVLEKTVEGWSGFLAILAAAREKDLINGKMVHTLLLNAINPNHYKLGGSGTMPFGFASGDIYGIEAVGVRNNSAANQVARQAFYEVVEVAPAGPLSWSVASQKDFDAYLPYECGFALRAKTNASLDSVGRRVSPFGNGVVTWPNATFAGEEPGTDLAPDAGDVRPWAEDDNRVKKAEHWSKFHEGIELKKRSLTYALKDSIGEVVAPLKLPSGFSVSLGTVNYPIVPLGWTQPPGAVELWARSDTSPSTQSFLDVCYKENENHLWLKYDSGALSLGVRDGGLEGSSAEVRYDAALEKGTWYHLSATWLNTRYGQLGMMLDGRPVGNFGYYDRNGRRIDGRTTGGLGTAEPAIACTGALPQKGCAQIGLELIEYDGISGGLQNCRRGARGTAAQAHPPGAPVYPLGYSDPVAKVTVGLPPPLDLQWDRIPVVRGVNAKDFGDLTSCELFNPMNPRPGGGIQASDPIIPVRDPAGAADATAEFPDRGYLLITGDIGAGMPAFEVVYYESKIPNGFVVNNNGRGIDLPDFPSDGQDFLNGAVVHLFSIELTDNKGFSANNGVCLFQIDDEWFVGKPFDDPNGVLYMIGLRIAAGRINAFITFGDQPLMPAQLGIGVPGRAIFDTVLAPHTAQTAALPVFAVTYGSAIRPDDGTGGSPPGQYPMAGVQYDYGLVGKHDVVTIVAADQVTKELATVHNGRCVRMGTPVNLVALSAMTTREYVADPAGGTRLLKFPSGEMLSYAPGPVYIAEGAPATQRGGNRLPGRLDELKFFSGKGCASILAGALSVNSTTLLVFELGDAAQTDFSHNGGAIQLGDEMISYSGYRLISDQQSQLPTNPPIPVALRVMELLDPVRGFLRTQASAHEVGDMVIKHFGMAAIALDRAVGDTDAVFPTKNVLAGQNSGAGSIPQYNGFPTQGFFLADDELVGWTSVVPGNVSTPRKPDDTGAFRGAFGTKPDRHAVNSVIVAMPYRYADRHRDKAWDDTMSHYTITRRASGALWKRVTWTAEVPDRKLAVKALVRVDGSPGWDATPTNKPGGLWLFTDEKGKNVLGTRGDQVEVRFVFEWKKDSYEFSDWKIDAWKQAPALQSIRVDYEQPVTSRYYEAR